MSGRAVTACVQQGHMKQVCARYLVWPVLMIYQCAEKLHLGYITFQIVLMLVQCCSFAVCVFWGFCWDCAEFSQPWVSSFVSTSWDFFYFSVWVIAGCSISVSLQLELLGMTVGLLCAKSVTGRRSALRPSFVLLMSNTDPFGSLQGSFLWHSHLLGR